jgi:putative ABC transport system ATP-binding protein
MPLCQLINLDKTFTHGQIIVYALKEINLTVDYGDFIAVMGTSGSGKTTLLNILGCLDTPSGGNYLLNMKDVSSLSDDELSEMRNDLIGFVFQSFYLLPYATVSENILLPTVYSRKQSHDKKERLNDLLKMTGLDERATFKPEQLSGGQKQRVAIARALINNPQLILCDEPTGQLDSKTASSIMELLKNLNEQGKTIILITHDKEVARYAHKTFHLIDGRLTD